MTIASELTKLNTNMQNAYTACDNKGATLPQAQNMDNLAVCINSIPTVNNTTLSVTPTTSSQSLSPSSPYTGYSSVSVNAVTSSIDSNISAGNIKKDVSILGVTGTYEGEAYIGIPREVSQSGWYQMPSTNFTFSLPSNATTLSAYSLCYAFYDCQALTSVDLSSLTALTSMKSLYYAFYNCQALTSVDLSSLTTVSNDSCNYAFYNCKYLTSVNLSSLTTVSGSQAFAYAFYYCQRLPSVDFSSLTTVTGSQSFAYCFGYCTALEHLYFQALKTTSFGSSLKNQFSNMLNGTGKSVTHTLHFPSNLSSTISTLTGYPNFGGTSGYVTLAFDLPATS